MEAEKGTLAQQRASRRARGIVAPMLVTASVVALVLGGLWIARAPIAENLIGQELDARNVRMTYRLASIGLRTQRIEDIVLGNPLKPDLSARWVEIDISYGFSPTVSAVRAGGVRINGVLSGGVLSLGELDKFMGKGDSAATTLPDIAVALNDARASIHTDYGGLGIVMEGRGGLRNGFDGRAMMAMPHLTAQGCAGQKLRADVRIRMVDGAPRVRGPVTADALACPSSDLALAAPRIDLDARLNDTLDGGTGSARLSARAARAVGLTLDAMEARFRLRAADNRFDGSGSVGGRAMSGRQFRTGQTALALRFDGALSGQDRRIDGDLNVRNLAQRGGDPLAPLAISTAGTPFAPLVAGLSRAVRTAGGNNNLSAKLALHVGNGRSEASASAVHFAAASGARIDLPGKASFNMPENRWALAGGLTTGGGGLPHAALSLTQGPRGGVSGRFTMQPYAAGGARLALTPVQFGAGPGGESRFLTAMTLDGPLADGGVKGLILPLSGSISPSGAFALNSACVPVRWQELRVSSLQLGTNALSLCPEGGAMVRYAGGKLGGGVSARSVDLNGRMGDSPIRLRAADFAFSLARTGVQARGLDLRVGGRESPVILAAATLDGAMDKGGMSGRFGGGHARIGAVPLDMTDLVGRWRFAGGRLDVDGALRVSDTAPAARFNPLVAPDARLVMADGRITATGRLRHPTQGDPFATVQIAHDLSSGRGNARFALLRLRFGPALQPDDLTPMALGVVANADGTVTGEGEIRWTGDRVTSTGRFSTIDMNLAAAFGPVEGLSTTLNFTDLLSVETAPGQVATIRSVNPGVVATDGRVTFQLQPGARARIEGGEWPFAGGRLTLLPSTLDFDAKGARNLIFRVTGLDAGSFINTLDLKNISATGTYDGLLPMVFDATGGRIAGGILVARQEEAPPLVVENAQSLTVPCDPTRQAGTLSYVGEVSNAQMGAYGKMAFDALKRLRYKCLTILLDGAIDGEFLTRIAINGVNQGSEESRKSAIARQFLGIPFLFNVRIEAPFRGLLNTYQSFVDPSALISGSLGPQYQTVLENKLAVQPPESDKAVPKEGE
ncbi:MAG: YdbH domain-containing protein [Sphingobium sp.]